MKKFFSTTMRRCFLALLFTTTLGLANVWAQAIVVKSDYNPGSVTVVIDAATGTSDACLKYTTQSTNTGEAKDFTVTSITGVSGPFTYSWSIKGGAEIVGSTTGSTVTVKPKIVNNRFNKARLFLTYTATKTVMVPDDCTTPPGPDKPVTVGTDGQVYVDLYQHFTYTDPIVGEECIDASIDYAFSIRDMVSGNADNIGIDSYVWDLTDIEDFLPPISPTPPSQRLYTSGDESAIALDFTLDLSETKEISVIPGRCNTIPVVHTFRRKMPPATYSITGYADCIPTSIHQITISNDDVDANINYSWEFSNSNYTFVAPSTSTSAAGITINIGTEAGFIYLKSTPANSTYCSGTLTGEIIQIIEIKRSLDAGVSISGPSCVLPGGPYEYKLNPNVNTKLSWDLPEGWTIDGDNINASTVNISVDAEAEEGEIVIHTLGCTGETVSKEVFIKPGTLGSISTATACLTYGSTSEVVVSVTAIPNTVQYVWNIGGWSFKPGTDQHAASVTLIPNGTTGALISVYAEGSCENSNTVQLQMKVTPNTPGTITRDPSGCINKGLEDLVNFTVTNDPNAESYIWTLGSIGTGSSTTNTIAVTTVGTGGPYQVKVKAVNSCGNSADRSLTVTFAGNGTIAIAKTDLMIDEEKVGENLEAEFTSNTSYQWFKDGNAIATGRQLDIYDLDDPVVNHSYCVVATNTNTCITKTCTTSDYNYSGRVSQPQLEKNVAVFPNPAEHLVSIEVKVKFKSGTITLFDKNGTQLSKSAITSSNNVIDVSNLSNGTYFVSVAIDGESTMKKVQVIH